MSVDWRDIDPILVQQIHDAYVAGHPTRLQSFLEWLRSEDFDTTQVETYAGFESLEGLWTWLMSRPSLPGHEPLETASQATLTTAPKTDWWPTLVSTEPLDPGVRWIRWWLTDEALDLCSGIAAVVTEMLIRQYGLTWQLDTESFTADSKNQTTLGSTRTGRWYRIERGIVTNWFRRYEAHYGPNGDRGGDPVWHWIRVALHPELDEPWDEPVYEPILVEWEEEDEPDMRGWFILDIDFDEPDHAHELTRDQLGRLLDEHADRIDQVAHRLVRHPLIKGAEQTDRTTIHGIARRGVTLARITKIATRIWNDLSP